jgi:hypothetical protein
MKRTCQNADALITDLTKDNACGKPVAVRQMVLAMFLDRKSWVWVDLCVDHAKANGHALAGKGL